MSRHVARELGFGLVSKGLGLMSYGLESRGSGLGTPGLVKSLPKSIYNENTVKLELALCHLKYFAASLLCTTSLFSVSRYSHLFENSKRNTEQRNIKKNITTVAASIQLL